jgi:O-antigen/teichoic acid export membrane protein
VRGSPRGRGSAGDCDDGEVSLDPEQGFVPPIPTGSQLPGGPVEDNAVGNATRAARGAIWLSVASWSAKGAQTATILVLAHFFTPAQFGIISIATLTYNVLGAISNFGIIDAITFQKDRVDEAARTSLSILVAVGLLLAGAAWAAAPSIAGFFHSPQATWVLRGFAVALPIDVLSDVPRGLLTRSLRFARRTLTDALPALIGSAITIVLAATGHGLSGLVAGTIASAVSQELISLAVGPRHLPGWSTEVAKQLLSYGSHLGAAAIALLLLLNVDYIIVGHVLGPVPLGQYSLAYRVAYMPFLAISFVIGGVAFPYFCRLGDKHAIARASEKVHSLVNAATVPCYTACVLFASYITLLGHKWAPAVTPIRLLAVYGLFFSMINIFEATLKASDMPRRVLYSRLIQLVTLTVTLVLTASAGINVVALDQALVAALVAVVNLWWAVRAVRMHLGAIAHSLALPLLGALGMAAAVSLLRLVPSLRVTSWASLLILAAAGGVVYVGIVLATMPEVIRQGLSSIRGGEDDAEKSRQSPVAIT